MYQISRNGQLYGPYTLEDLKQYVASGHVLLTDSAKTDDMPDWIPVSQVLGATAGSVPPSTGAPLAAGVPGAYPPAAAGYPGAVPATPSGVAYEDPPNLNWGLVLLFGFLTCGIFIVVYDLIQASWWKRIRPDTKVLTYYIAALAAYAVNLLISVGNVFAGAHAASMGSSAATAGMTGLSALGTLASLAYLVLILVARFTFRTELEQHYNGPEPLGLRLSGVMVFFFGGLYFQYHFNRINQVKQAMRYGTGVARPTL